MRLSTTAALLISLLLVGCSGQELTRSDAQAALIDLAEKQGEPLALTIPALEAGHIRYMRGKEEGIPLGPWCVDLSRKTFVLMVGNDEFLNSYSGAFRRSRGGWEAVITEEENLDAWPNSGLDGT